MLHISVCHCRVEHKTGNIRRDDSNHSNRVIAVIFLPNAKGRLWDTRDQVEARYGKPIHCNGDQSHGIVCAYNYQRFHVVVTFLDGKSQSELFYRSDNKYLVPFEVGKLMEMNPRENYTWYPGNRMFVLIPRWPGFPDETNAKKRGPAIAIAARFPDSANPWSFHICTAEFAKKFGSRPSKVKP
jgi:hypothetical protein